MVSGVLMRPRFGWRRLASAAACLGLEVIVHGVVAVCGAVDDGKTLVVERDILGR